MAIEIRNGVIHVPVFYAPNGLRTCSIGILSHETCPFYGTKSFGQREVCTVTGDPLSRDNNGRGHLLVNSMCPITEVKNAN